MNSHICTRSLMLIAMLTLSLSQAIAQGPQYFLDGYKLSSQGSVRAIAHDSTNGKIYIGGSFNSLEKHNPNGFSIDLNDSILSAPNFPGGGVTDAIPDENGGWFFCGDFSLVGDSIRRYVAQIDSNGQLTSFSHNPGSVVRGLYLHNDTLYMTGDFTTFNDSARGHGAAIDLNTQELTPFDPKIINSTPLSRQIIRSGNTVYLRGFSYTVDTSGRAFIAAFDAYTGNLLPWNPSPNNFVNTMAVHNGSVYIGGRFTSIDGIARANIAAIDSATGTVSSWDPGTDTTVWAIAIANNKLFLGGEFTSVAGQNINYLASVDLTTAQLDPWYANADSHVKVLSIYDNSIYAAGSFTNIGGQNRNGLAELDLNTATATNWDPGFSPTSSIGVLDISNSQKFIGGGLSRGNIERNNIASFNIPTGAPASWAPSIDGTVYSVITNDNDLFICGTFDTIDGQARDGLASFDLATGNLNPWSIPKSNFAGGDQLLTLHLDGNTLYVGGHFDTIAGQARNNIAAFDISTGNLTNWAPIVSPYVSAITTYDSLVYIGGYFTLVNNISRPHFAELKKSDASLTATDHDINGLVTSLVVDKTNELLYIGGAYTSIDTFTRSNVAAMHLNTKQISPWAPDVNGSINSMTLTPSKNGLVIGGGFTGVNGIANRSAAILSTTSNDMNTWTPKPFGSVFATTYVDSFLFIGGDFTGLKNGGANVEMPSIYGNSTHYESIKGFATFKGSVSWPAGIAIGEQWTGAVDSDWSNPDNWLNNIVPQAGDDVTITEGAANMPVLDVDVEVGTLFLQSFTTLTVPLGRNITVDGDLINWGGLNVENGGALVQTPGSILSNSGSMSVLRNIPGNLTYISSPVENVGVADFGLTPTGTDGSQLIPNTLNPCNPDSLDSSSDNGVLLELREDASVIANCSQSLWHVKSANTLTDGRGYSASIGSAVLTYVGTVNNGPVSYSGLTRQAGTIDHPAGATITRGWNLVGNPYPSPITLTGADLINMGFDAQIQRYDGVNGTWIVNDPLTSVDIPVGQGFLVRKTTVGGTADFSLDNSYRTTGNPQMYRLAGRTKYLNMVLENGTVTDTTQVCYEAGASDDFDPDLDASRLVNESSVPYLYTVANNEYMRYNTYPELDTIEARIVPVGYYPANQQSSFTISFFDVTTLGLDSLYFEDLLLDSITQVTEGGSYEFTPSVLGQHVDDRFLLHFINAATVVPVDTTTDTTTNPIDTTTNPIDTTSIYDIEASNVKIYPNPVNNELSLELGEGHQYTEAVVLGLTGNKLAQINLSPNSPNYRIATDELPQGIYFIRLEGDVPKTLRFIKQ